MERIVKIGGKYYDTKTPNKSFLKVALDLKKVGVDNWYFMLEIKDISLCKIDPHQRDKKTERTTLTRDQIQHVMFECRNNVWYYLREVCRIPEPGAPNGIPYRANRGNIAQTWCLLHGIDSWLCLPRQQGKTISALAMILWIYSFGTTNSNFIFINKDGENAKENLRRISNQIDVLPEYLQFTAVISDEDGKIVKANKSATRMVHPVTKNQITIKAKATSYDMALSLARGLTAPILHFDEPEFTSHIKTIVDNSVSTFDTAAQRSKQNGSIYGRIFTCTPGDLDTAMGMEAQLLLENTVEWDEKMYDWNEQQREEYINANDSNRIVYIEYNYHQIGKTEEWFKNLAAKINDPLVVRREILLQRLRGSDTSPYAREDIDAIIDAEQKPIDEFFLCEYYKVKVYEELEKKIPYIVGIDCSTGTVGDNNSMTIINPYTVKVVAEFECSYVGETMYEACIKELVMKHLPKAVLCIERNSVGDGIIDHLLHSPIVGNLYFDKDKDLMGSIMRDNESQESILKRQAKEKTFYGVYTNGASREQMFAILARHVTEFQDKFVAHNVIRDLSRLVKKSSGKIEAGAGFHDDAIMSYLIGLYVYYHGNNLYMFGIEKGMNPEEEENTGLTRDDGSVKDIPVDALDLPQEVTEMVKSQQEKEENTLSYEDMMRRAVYESQKETQLLQSKGLLKESDFSNTPDYLLDDFRPDEGNIPLDFFDDLNF